MMQTDLYLHSSTPLTLDKPRSCMTIVGKDDPRRPQLQELVRSGFGTHFQACIEGFMPDLVHYEESSGGNAVVGLRRASDEPLFLENYLGRPVEEIIASESGERVCRRRIAEIGQFVVNDRDIVSRVFRQLVPFLASQGFDWVCFTGTNRIRAILSRMHFTGLSVASADMERVRHTGDHWGNYYEHDPQVVIGKLDDPEGHWCSRPRPSVMPSERVA